MKLPQGSHADPTRPHEAFGSTGIEGLNVGSMKIRRALLFGCWSRRVGTHGPAMARLPDSTQRMVRQSKRDSNISPSQLRTFPARALPFSSLQPPSTKEHWTTVSMFHRKGHSRRDEAAALVTDTWKRACLASQRAELGEDRQFLVLIQPGA